MKSELRNAVAVLFLLGIIVTGCHDSPQVTGLSVTETGWGEATETSTRGVDLATVVRYEVTHNDHMQSVVLWSDVEDGGSVKQGRIEAKYPESLVCGDIRWDVAGKTMCSFEIRLRDTGRHTIEIDGREYDLNNGNTILFKNRGGKVEVKQIAGIDLGVDLENANSKYAHENQEIVDFYSDNQHPEGQQNKTQREKAKPTVHD